MQSFSTLGQDGEHLVMRWLKALPPGSFALHDLVLPGRKGNIDHVVLAPAGVFALETKHHRGTITCHKDSWTQVKASSAGIQYSRPISSPSQQAKANADALWKFVAARDPPLAQSIGAVTPGVVFTNESAAVHLSQPTVPVLRPADVVRFVTASQGASTLSIATLQRLHALLEPYSLQRARPGVGR